MSILKTKYFVAATIETKKKDSSHTNTTLHNGIIDLWFFRRIDNRTLRNLSLTFANNIAAQNGDLEIKRINITAFNRI